MLKENVLYRENLPVNCSIMKLEKYPIHFHNDLEIVYVLQGNLKLKNGYFNYNMKEGDIYILNDREIHSYNSTGEPNAVLILQLNLAYFSRYYEILRNSFFITDVNGAQDESIGELQELLARIALENSSCKRGFEKRIINLAHNLINCLINNFQYFVMEDGKFVNESKNKGNKVLAGRLSRITEFMYENYSRRLTLTEIAEREHLSIYYLSHFIKEATGMSFQELLSFIRVEESEKLLLGTDKKIGVISVESGFSAVRYYIKYFTKWFGMHPSDYRKEYTDSVKGRDSSARFVLLSCSEAEELLCPYVEVMFNAAMNNQIEVIAVEFDTEEYVWNENDTRCVFTSLMKTGFMKPVYETLRSLNIDKGDIVKSAPGYFIMRNSGGSDNGNDKNSYCLLLYNLSEKLLSGKLESGYRRTEEELRRYDRQREFFIKFIGLAGAYRIARCSYTKEALIHNNTKSCIASLKDMELMIDKREALVKAWTTSPAFSVAVLTASSVMNVQSLQAGSCVELVLIDLV